eukprot:m.96899 g.96899  ORF g.96899 m.96899 type:complete len:403 (-) comp26937_c0_seq1:37-1245(-)
MSSSRVNIGFAIAIVVCQSLSAAACGDVKQDCGASGNGKGDDTHSFNQCINTASIGMHGGCVTVPAGTYAVNGILMNESNVALRFDAGVTLQPPLGQTNGFEGMIVMGSFGSSAPAHNISVIGSADGAVVIDCTLQAKIRSKIGAIRLTGNVKNFVVGNVITKMAYCEGAEDKNPCLNTNALAMGNMLVNNVSYHPTDGHVYNITNTGSWGGYGLVQVQSAEDILFENLDSTGGVTLRMETGVQLPGSYVGNITAHHLICRDGSSGFEAEPHSQMNGNFYVYDITTYGCFSGIYLGAGYIQSKNGINHTVPGFFGNDSLVHGVVANWGAEGAQCDDLCRKSKYNGTSCAACVIGENAAHPNDLGYDVDVQGMTGVDFPFAHDYTKCTKFNRHFMDCSLWPSM